MKIKDIVENNTATLKVLCSQVTVGTSQAGDHYLSLQLKDKTGNVVARLWNASAADITAWKEGQIYEVEGIATLYRQNMRIKINSYSQLAISDIDMTDFYIQAPIDHDKVYRYITKTIANFSNPNYQKIMTAIFEVHGEQFKIWPAAISIHHAIGGGLMWHTYTMLKSAEALLLVYADREIDAELLQAGVILHDMGKILEIKSPTESKFTQQGKLIGHISIMQAEINRIGSTLNIEPKFLTLLQHMVIASHGKMEFGSPVTPRIIEAEILSTLDILDARIYIIDNELKKIKVNEQTARLFPLDGRAFTRHYESKK